MSTTIAQWLAENGCGNLSAISAELNLAVLIRAGKIQNSPPFSQILGGSTTAKVSKMEEV
ncbi:hypothetical protein AYI86_13525 [Shewanella algae]|nr:hypothetical protein AYI86_13525 [Shewanella algae]